MPGPSGQQAWTLDGVAVGRGREVWSKAPAEGEHELVLTARSGGLESKAVVRFKTARFDPDPGPKR